MTEAAKRQGRGGRGGMLAAIQKDAPAPEKDAGGTDPFRLRVAGQRFMNEYRAIFEAFAKLSDQPKAMAEDGGLAGALAAAKSLALATARRFTGKEAPSEHEVAPFRTAAAQVVAHAWEAGGMRAFDAAAVAEQHAAAFRLVDLEAGHRSIFQDRDISAAASLAMTAAVVAEVLIRPVSVYDFRRDKGELLGAMVPAVMEVAAGYARQAVPDGRADDFRSVLQTAANGLAAVMAGVYERKSRQVVARIAGLPEAEREAFARRYDPMPEVLRAFSELGLVFVAAALAVGQRAAGAAARQDNSPAR